MLYLLDWDDTLATGPLTWALENALPGLVTRFGEPRTPLSTALLAAQQAAAATYDEELLMATFLADMGWPAEAALELQRAVVADFTPVLFPDVLPFLARLRATGATVVVVSNNNRAPSVAAALGVDRLVSRFVTPSMGYARKPSREMIGALGELNPWATTMVGDDPFTDAPFAAACGLGCSIVDRFGRYAALPLEARIVPSLADL